MGVKDVAILNVARTVTRVKWVRGPSFCTLIDAFRLVVGEARVSRCRGPNRLRLRLP